MEGVEQEAGGRALDVADEREALVDGVEEVGLEAVERLDGERDATGLGVVGEHTQVAHDALPVGGLGARIVGLGAADHGVERADDITGAELGGLVDELGKVEHRRALLGGGAAQVAAGPERGADRADGNASLVGGIAEAGGMDVLRVLDRHLDGLEAPAGELAEQRSGLRIGEGAGVKESVESESHGGPAILGSRQEWSSKGSDTTSASLRERAAVG